MELAAHDYQNILALLKRVPVNGLYEAETLVVLAQKLRGKLQPIPLVKDENGDVSNNH